MSSGHIPASHDTRRTPERESGSPGSRDRANSLSSRANLVLALVSAIAATLAIFLWIPLDTSTGFIERVRGRPVIGDALAPTVACLFVILGAITVLTSECRGEDGCEGLGLDNLAYIARAIALIFLSLAIMRFAGPFAVWLSNFLTGEEATYRELRATVPWSWIGYLLGGAMLVIGFMTMIERRPTHLAVAIGLAISILFVVIVDLPFDSLILPPNGDV